MARPKTIYVCQHCGQQSPKWFGRCSDCGQWNSVQEELQAEAGGAGRGRAPWSDAGPSRPLGFDAITSGEQARARTGMAEFDRVLGGGVVPGSLVLIGGDPGIGKSTLLLQALDRMTRGPAMDGGDDRPVLYVSGEESPQQVKMRADRVGVTSPALRILPETVLEQILETARQMRPRALAIDSIQTVFTGQLGAAPGSVSQLRETAGQLMLFAKQTQIPTFLIGHVTKEGTIAGPRLLEHIVDTVLYFEGDKGHPFRILRAVKNRFGSTNEIGVFEMKGAGLEEVSNPSELFLADRPVGVPVAGSVVVSSLEGTRPILVELQALVSPTNFGMPRRMAIGIEPNRLALLLAVLEKRAGMQVQSQDVFVNLVGGLEIGEPAADLGIVAAVASAFRDRPVDARTLVFGEVGLGGEIRPVAQAEVRLREAAKMGFKRCLMPQRNVLKLADGPPLEVHGVEHIRAALEALLA